MSGGVSSAFYGSLFTQNHQLLPSVASESQKTDETPPLKTVSILEAETCGTNYRDSTPGNIFMFFINKDETVLCVAGDTTNMFINENWQELYKELRPVIAEAIGFIVQHVVQIVLNEYSYNEIFPEN